MRAGKTFVSVLNCLRQKHEIMLRAYPIRLFYLPVWPRAVLEILTYYVYAPVSPRCPCPNFLQQLRPLGKALSLVNMRHIFQQILPRRLWLAGLPCLALLGCVQSYNKPALNTPAEEKFRFINWLIIFLLNVVTSGRCKGNQPKLTRFTGYGRWIVPTA